VLSNLNALLVAWAISLIVIIGGTVYLQLSYDGAGHDNPEAISNGTENSSEHAEHDNVADNTSETTSTNSNDDLNNSDHSTAEPQAVDKADTTANTGQGSDAQGSEINDLDPELSEENRLGKLPIIAADGRASSLYYASTSKPDASLPRIAIIVTDIGRRARQTKRAIDRLPSAVTFAFSPYGTELDKWSETARKQGHESLLMIPMEPTNSAQNDAGPLALLTSNNSRQNLNLLRSSLARMQGYVGVINHMGSRFTATSNALTPVLEEIENRGLLFVDSRSTQFSRAAEMSRALNIPTALNNSYIDSEPNAAAISNELAKLEGRARTLGAAVGIIRTYPISINAIEAWSAKLKERGYQLVPISQIADLQPLAR
jgi:polysaccharide deacetylase 2 family uncharacterized protein YibQ